jgi:predicted metal-dependent enzyme (double-stranded beta helix superfamily)
MRVIIAGGILLACSGCLIAQRRTSPAVPETSSDLSVAIADTLAEARAVVDDQGLTGAAMERMEAVLARLAKTKGLIEHADLDTLHGDSKMGAQMLASEGDHGISLYLVRFADGTVTPVHDHLTWGVLHVLEGHDRYTARERLDQKSDPKKAQLRIAEERVLSPSDSAHWLGPPRDIHSQEAVGGPVWELVMTGENVLHEHVTQNRHYFDPETDVVTQGTPSESTEDEAGAKSQGHHSDASAAQPECAIVETAAGKTPDPRKRKRHYQHSA